MMQPGSSYGDPTRANDADRAGICAILDNAYADGELDPDEHRQRCSSAMAAKTRGQLLDLISDLQARRPAFTAQPAIAARANPNRKWVIGAIVGGGCLAAIGVLGISGFFVSRDTSPGPLPMPAAPARNETVNSNPTGSETLGTLLPLLDVVATVSGDFQDQIGHTPEHVTCPGDLAGQVGAFERCSISDNGKRYNADVTVTAVDGNRVTTHEAINEEVSLPPSSQP
jgi:Domain of unknown function (DUF1707)/Domain of unknown function (DUF4333)